MTTKKAVQFVKVFIFTVAEACVFYKKHEKEIKGFLSPLVDACKEIRNQSKVIEYSKWCITVIVYHRYDYKKRKLFSFSNLIRSFKTIGFHSTNFFFDAFFTIFIIHYKFSSLSKNYRIHCFFQERIKNNKHHLLTIDPRNWIEHKKHNKGHYMNFISIWRCRNNRLPTKIYIKKEISNLK